MQKYNWTSCPQFHEYWEMIVKIFHEWVNQSTTKNVEEDLQKLEDKINTFAGQKGVLIHDIKYEKIQKDQNATNDYSICSPHCCKWGNWWGWKGRYSKDSGPEEIVFDPKPMMLATSSAFCRIFY